MFGRPPWPPHKTVIYVMYLTKELLRPIHSIHKAFGFRVKGWENGSGQQYDCHVPLSFTNKEMVIIMVR